MRQKMLRQCCVLLVAVVGVLLALPAFAVDNPNDPDYVADFEKRAQPYEARISESAGTTGEVIAAYADYDRFLEAELNQSYQALTKKLGPVQKRQLVQSQNKWLAFRAAEIAFIDGNWTVAQFGTSSHLSRGDYRSTITKDRILALLNYLKNYS